MAVVNWLKGVFESKRKTAEDKKQLREIEEQLIFVKSAPLTLGVELELALLDKETLKPAHKALEIIDEANTPEIKKEALDHMVEITTGICKDVHHARQQLDPAIRKVMDLADKRNCYVTGTGRPPTQMMDDCTRTPDKRYDYQHDLRKVFSERFGTLGMHVHIGVENQEKCIRFHNFFTHFLPHFTALSASSPFEEGRETGIASMRPAIAEGMPIAGMPYHYKTWQDYVSLCHAVFRSGTIRNLKDLWWDIRPCPIYGTFEIRICDQPATLREAMAIVAFIHGLSHWFAEHQSWLDEMPRPNAWRARENKWRAMRYGLDAELVINNNGDTCPVREDIESWLQRLQPYVDTHNYHDFIEDLRMMMKRGNSALRQQRMYALTGSAERVCQFNCDEMKAMTPLWDKLEAEEQAQKTTPLKQQNGNVVRLKG